MLLTRVRVRWWEGVLLCIPASLSVVFLLGGQIAAGLVLAALVMVLVASRAQIVGRNVAGGYARTRAFLLLGRWAALLAIYAVVVWLFFVMHDEHWTRDRHGRVAFWALVGLAFFLAREAYRVGEVAGDWWLGSETEREVAQLLDPLRAEGWLVIRTTSRRTAAATLTTSSAIRAKRLRSRRRAAVIALPTAVRRYRTRSGQSRSSANVG